MTETPSKCIVFLSRQCGRDCILVAIEPSSSHQEDCIHGKEVRHPSVVTEIVINSYLVVACWRIRNVSFSPADFDDQSFVQVP